MAFRKSSDQKNSRYSQGGETEQRGERLGWWERTIISRSDDDIFYTISPEEEGRPDLIAYKFWGEATLMWLVLQYNHIVDVNEELVPGNVIVLPPFSRVITELTTNSTGAVIVAKAF